MFRFPYTDFHRLNLDWFLAEWKNFLAKIDDKIASVAGITARAESIPYNQPVDVVVSGGAGTSDPYILDFKIPRGVPVTVSSTNTAYAAGTSASTIPDVFTENMPYVEGGQYLWTRINTIFSDGTVSTSYSVARQGIDGMGAVDSVNGKTGAVVLTGEDVPYAADNETSIHEMVEMNGSDITSLDGRMTNAESDISNLTHRLGTAEGNINNIATVNEITNISIEPDFTNSGSRVFQNDKLILAHIRIKTTKSLSTWTSYQTLTGLPIPKIGHVLTYILYPSKYKVSIDPLGRVLIQSQESAGESTNEKSIEADLFYFTT